MKKLLALLEELRSYALPPEFKDHPDYPVDRKRYDKIGKLGKGAGHKLRLLSDQDVGGAYVKAHWNILSGGYSVKPPHDGSTLGHVHSLHLGGPVGVRPEIQETNRQRYLKSINDHSPQGQKNPHAFLHGVVQSTQITEEHVPDDAFPIGYSPKKGHFFRVQKGEDGKMAPGDRLDHADEVFMLPPHPDVTKAYQQKADLAREAGENMTRWKQTNKAPIGRVFARVGKEKK